MWTKYFKLIKIRRGRVITPRHGEIDFSRDDIPIEICKELYEEDFQYLEITEEGKREFYGIEPPETSQTEKDILQETVETEVSPPNRKNNRKKKP